MEKILTFVLAIGLSKKDLEDLGFPEKVTSKDLKNLSEMMGRLLQERDFRPLMRRAALALGLKPEDIKAKDIASKISRSQALLNKAHHQGGLTKKKVLHPLPISRKKA